MKLKLTWRLHSNHVLFPFHFAFSSFSCSSLIFSGHSCLLTLFIFTSVYVYSILFPSSMYSDSTLQQLIGLSYMVDSTYIVLFSLCLFTTSSKCTMFTGVVLICGFSLSLSLSRSLPLSLSMILFVSTYIPKTCPGVGRRLLPAKLFFGSTFHSIRLWIVVLCTGNRLPGLWRQQHLRLSIMGSGRRWQSWNSYVLCQTWTCKQLWGNGIGM